MKKLSLLVLFLVMPIITAATDMPHHPIKPMMDGKPAIVIYKCEDVEFTYRERHENSKGRIVVITDPCESA